LDRTRDELNHATDRVHEIEQKCDDFENRARAAENRYRDALRNLRELEELKSPTSLSESGLSDTLSTMSIVNGHSQEEREKLVNHILDGKEC